MKCRPAMALLALAGLAAAQSGAQAGAGVKAAGQAEDDPHRPSCNSASCRKIRSFLKAHYCGESPFGNGPEDSCDVKDPKPDKTAIDVIAHFECQWSETQRKDVCQQHGQPPSGVHGILIRELRRLGLPAAEDTRTYFTLWKSRSSGWSLAEGYNAHLAGSDVTLCQVILMIGPNSQVVVVRELPFQKTDADVPMATTWSLLDLTDIDGDGRPDAILRGDAYEDHWIEVHSVQNGLPRMIFSGLGYYL
jgi:hypothetical protein